MATSNSSACEEAVDVLKGPVKYAGKQMNVVLTTKGLTLVDTSDDGQKKAKEKGLELSWADVILAQTSKKFKGNDGGKGFCIHYMQLQSNKKLQVKTDDFLSTGEPSADAWITAINHQCASVKGRPKKLFVIVNPIGGSGSGQSIFEKRVRRIFEMAQIESEVCVTERAQHTLEIGKTKDFSSYDGIVIVGGDGSYQEILHGLTIQTQTSEGVDYNDPTAKLKPLSTPIGVIPGGTGNGVSGWFNGVVDVETAALRIVRGEQQQATLLSVHSAGKLFTVCGLLIGYGFFSDMIKRTQELRWMKRARYPYCLLGSILNKKRTCQCSLQYRLAPKPSDQEGKSELSSTSEKEEGAAVAKDSVWIEHDSKGRVYGGVSAFIAQFVKKGEKFYCDAFPDSLSLLVDHGCSTIGVYKHLIKYLMCKPIDTLPNNLEVIERVQGFRLKLIQDPAETDTNVTAARAKARDLEHYLDVDGEAQRLDVPEFELKIVKFDYNGDCWNQVNNPWNQLLL